MNQKRKKKKGASKLVKLVTISGLLSLIQIGWLIYKGNTDKATQAKAAIDSAASSVKDPFRRELARIRAALHLYRVENQNKFPTSLAALIPKFLDSIPVNPKTGKNFEYALEGRAYRLLDVDDGKSSSGGNKRSGDIRDSDLGLQDIPDIATIVSDFIYDPSGKRDPFTPFDYSIPINPEATPLQRYALSQLKLSSILDLGGTGKRAMIETTEGKGYTAKVGTLIGNKNGEVVEITNDRVKILESYVDFAGKEHNSVRELKLKSAGE